MTTLAEAAVEIIADTEGFEGDLRRGIETASSTAQRASQDMGSRMGRSITSSAQKALGGLGRVMRRPLDALGGQLTRLGSTISTALDATPLTRNLRSGLSSVVGSASRLGSTLGTVGSTAQGAFTRMRDGLSSITQGLRQSESNAGLLNSSLSRMAGLGAGVAAAVGVGQLGVEIGQVASSAQTTQASLTALYEAAGSGADEVNALMDEMSERFRGLDMGVMNEGATTLAYMGLQGTEAVDVLERLDAATTAAGTGADGMTRALDAMTSGVNAGKFQMGELSQISNAGIPIYDALAEVLGVDIPEAQAMASDGAVELEHVLEALSGEAGTWFPALLEGADDVSETFAGSWDTLRNTFVNGIANELVPALDDLAPVLQGAASGVEGAFDQLPGAIEAVTSQVVDSGAWDTFESTLDGIGQVVSSLEPFFSGFASGLSTASGAVLTLVGHLEPAGDLLGRFADWLGDNEEAVRLVGSVLGGLAAGLAVYRTAALLGTLASQAFSAGVRGVGAAIRGIPLIGWVLGAIGALVTLYQTSERFRSIVKGAFTAVRDAVQPLIDRLSEVWEVVSEWDGWSIAWEAISGAVEDAWDAISGIWDSLSERWDSLFGGQSDTSWWQSTWDAFTSSLEDAWEIVSPILETIGQAFSLLSDLVTGDADMSDVGDFLMDAFSNLSGVGETIAGFIIDGLRSLPGRILGVLGNVGETVLGFFRGLPGRVQSMVGADDGWVAWLRDLPSRALPVLQNFGQTIVERIQDIPDMVRSRVDPGAIMDWLREVPGRILEWMQDYGPQILQGLGIAILVVVAGIPVLLLGLLAAIVAVLAVIAIEIAQWAWDAFTDMMTVAGQAVMSGIDSIATWFAELPGRVLEAVSDFGDRLASWGSGAISSLRSSLTSGMNRVRSWWSDMWSGIFSSARGLWDSFVDWGSGAAGRLRDAVMGPVNTLKDRMVGAFESAQAGIKSAWRTVKDVVGSPIEWVVNTAYNDWLRGVWGNVVEQFGGPALPEMTVNFARGGTMPGAGRGSSSGVFPGYTPGRDVHAMPMAAFSGGESVLRPEITKAWGSKTTLMLNKLARTGGVGAVRKALGMLFSGHNPFTGRGVPTSSGGAGGGFAQRFSLGGILESIGGSASRAASWLSGKAEEFGEGMMDFLDDPGGILEDIFSQIMDYSQMPNWGLGFTDLLKNVPEKIIELLVEKAKEIFSLDGDGDWADMGGNVGGRLGAALSFARSQAGKPYVWGGVGPQGYDCCIIPGVRIYGPDGAKKIEDMQPDDLVYSYVGGRLESHRVNAVWQSETQEVFAVRTRNRKVTASANHPFMRLIQSDEKATKQEDAEWFGSVPMPHGSRGTMQCTVSTCETLAWSRGMCNTHLSQWRKHGDPRTRQTTGNTYEVQWARADELQRGDFLVQPRQMPHEGEGNPLLPGGVPVDADLAWLIGAMVGDGTVTGKGIRLALYGEDREKATRILKDRFSGTPSHGDSYGIVLSNVAARDVFDSLEMRRPGPKKRVPNAVWGWSKGLQQAFLDGYCDADGHRPKNPARNGERTYHSASEDLIEDVRALHIILGHPVSNVSVTRRSKPIVIKGKEVKNALPQYSFSVWPRSGRGEGAFRRVPGLREWLDSGDFTLSKVLDVTPEGTQETWDMEVDQAHNFIADGVVVHNSGFMGAIHNVILGQRPYRRRYTTHGFTGSSAHGFRRNMPSPFTIGNTHANVGHMAGTLLGTNVESRGSAGVVVGSRARGTRNSLFSSRWGLVAAARSGRSGPMGGEGIAYDSGGLLPRGYSLTYNGTRSPETVRTAAQEANVERLVRLVGAQYGPRGSGSMLVPAGREREFARAVGDELPVGGTTVNAPVTVTTYAADPETVAYRTAARISRLAGI